jgi:hypothetical protein
MNFGKLVPFGMALALVLQGCSSTASNGGTTGGSCTPPCGANSTCTAGKCVCFTGTYSQCGTTSDGVPICANTASDNANCGTCGNACPGLGYASCLSGACVCLKNVCPAGDGGVVCTDTTTDSNNCGGCYFADAGVICGFGQICQNSTCSCGPGFTTCNALNPDGTPDGGTYCADTTTDLMNCGMCGTTCGNNQHCVPQGPMGVCACDTMAPDGGDLIQCSSGCVHQSSDPHNCGGCGIQCETGICNNGVCLCNPDAGILQCMPTRCADVNSDKTNCGACGNDCTQNGTLTFPNIVCKAGQCRCQGGQDYICPEPVSPFPATLACIDVSMDSNNCGGCGLLADGGGPLSDGGLPPSPYICSGVRSSCQNGSCICPNNELYCAPGSWNPDAGNIHNDAGICLNDTSDTLNCGGCGNNCDSLYAAEAVCQFASCTCIDAGICVTTVDSADPLHPSCDCNGLFGTPNPSCSTGASVTFLADIYPLLSNNTVTDEPTWGSGAVLVGCAVSGCHDSSAAGGLAFTDPDASYQELTNTFSTQICNGVSQQVVNPSEICLCQSLVVSGDGADSLLYTLLNNTFQCTTPNPDGGEHPPYPMPVDDAGVYHPLSACLAAQVRQWIDQGVPY